MVDSDSPLLFLWVLTSPGKSAPLGVLHVLSALGSGIGPRLFSSTGDSSRLIATVLTVPNM